MRNLLILVAISGFIFWISCNEQSNNPVQSKLSDQNEIMGLTKSGPQGPSANGQGSLIYKDGGRRIFSFHSKIHPDGSVSGQGTIIKVSSNPDQRLKFDFDIECLYVDNNIAIMSGIITKVVRIDITDTWPYPPEIGQPFQFKVIDNGEGVNADKDEMSYFDHGPDVPDCSEDVGWDLFTIDAGNIQVRP